MLKWATALELFHFSMSDALTELRELVMERFRRGLVPREPIGQAPVRDVAALWQLLAQRPAMFLGGSTGWHLAWFMRGLTEGGDWLSLPEFPDAKRIAAVIAERSQQAYGSEYGAFRVYGTADGARTLLAWVGIGPASS